MAKLSLDSDLCADLATHLELIARGGMPSPEHGAQLLRRLRQDIHSSGRGFTADPQDAEKLYREVPPPR